LYSSNKLGEQVKYPELAPYKEIQFVCAGPEYAEVLREVEQRLFYLLRSIPGVIPVYQKDKRGDCLLSAIYKDINLRPEILKLAQQFGISVETERRVSWEYVKQAQRELNTEDYDPNGPPPGPEFKPTMPAGTVRVDVSDVYDWYKLGQHISDMHGLGKHDFGKGPPSTIMAFGDEDLEHKYIDALKRTGLDTTDIDPVDPNQPPGMRRQKTDPTFNVGVAESFDQPYPLTWDRSPYGDLDAYTLLPDGTKIGIMFSRDHDGLWFVDFHRDHSTSVNDQGDSIRIFSTVMYAIQQFVKKVKPRMLSLMIHPEEVKPEEEKTRKKTPDRTGLYDALAKRYASGMGYTVTKRTTPRSTTWDFVKVANVAESASGYIPSNAERDDPRFKTALTVDIKPDSIKRNAKKLGLGNIHRSGIPQTARSDGKFK
jgi:hypothetical protein